MRPSPSRWSDGGNVERALRWTGSSELRASTFNRIQERSGTASWRPSLVHYDFGATRPFPVEVVEVRHFQDPTSDPRKRDQNRIACDIDAAQQRSSRPRARQTQGGCFQKRLPRRDTCEKKVHGVAPDVREESSGDVVAHIFPSVHGMSIPENRAATLTMSRASGAREHASNRHDSICAHRSACGTRPWVALSPVPPTRERSSRSVP